MHRILALALLFLGVSAQALELQYLSQVTLPHQMKFQKTKIGGLSGLTFDPTNSALYAVSDDRGNVNEPRLYELSLTATEKEFKVEPKSVIFLSVNQGELSHKSTKSKPEIFSKVLDLEGLNLAPWGDFLITNEGDMNQKPRVQAQVLDVKKDGTIVREFEVPSQFLSEPSGKQTKGVQNNLAFEGIAANPNGKEFLVSTEAPLVQDAKTFVRFIQYLMPEAWVLKPGKQWAYAYDNVHMPKEAMIEFQKGISDVLFLDDHRILVMERAALVTGSGMDFQIQIYEVDLTQGSDIAKLGAIPPSGLPPELKPLPKKLVLDLKDLAKTLGKIENFEGITLGPKLSDGRRSLILVSDDNFMRNLRTQFLLFAIKE